MTGRILIADGVATNRIILKARLAATSYQTLQAHSGAQALEMAGQLPPDLFIINGVLPDMDGQDLCKALGRNPATAPIPVIIVDSKSDVQTRLSALRAGADEILCRPIDENTLLARVRNLLRTRVQQDELERRQHTALDLGFAEAAPTFGTAGRIALVGRRPALAVGWRAAIADTIRAPIDVVPVEQLLRVTADQHTAPDVILLDADCRQPGGGLTLLAELRSRPATRHAAIIVVHDTDDHQSGVSALDMGASDLLTAQADPREMALRIRIQLQRKVQADRLRATVEDGLKLAMVDPLTGLFNRRYALPHLARVAARAKESGQTFAVMVLDLDHFKTINDQFGHAAGDAVLVEVSRRIQNNLRGVDLVARIGGEEFLVVMPDTDLAEARTAAERLRRVTAERPITVPGQDCKVGVTFSIGVSIGGIVDRPPTPVQTLVDQADRALLGAKSEGRNQVIFGQSAA